MECEVESFDQAIGQIASVIMRDKPKVARGFAREFGIEHFANALPLATRWLEWTSSTKPDDGFFGDSKVSDVGTIDVCALVDSCNSTAGVPREDQWNLVRIRSVGRGYCRGKTRGFFKKYTVERAVGLITEDGKWCSFRTFYTTDDCADWFAIGGTEPGRYPRPVTNRDEVREVRDGINSAAGIAITRDYDWRVSIGTEGGLSISLPTTPLGCREMFRFRDVPNGKTRRDALRNFVREHVRRKPADSGTVASASDLVFVKEHLRGATRFCWNGLSCVIHPAPYDLRRIADLK